MAPQDDRLEFAPVHITTHQRKKLVLCFDGTGNKFKGNSGDSNILKIFRMLDRSTGDQYHYYQPGIGTYITSTSLSHTSLTARFNSWYQKAMDSAVGTSFDQHVIGGYKFLMRYYTPGDELYFIGFSRGAYTARFLAEMLDYVGLVTQGNEEMVFFAWKTFSQWQQRHGGDDSTDKQTKRALFDYMKAFRETFTRPVKSKRFLGLFDTVNSVPRFEAAWMQRSKYPYTARSSAKVVRHAVAIDERRAKFRQDLISETASRDRRKKLSQEEDYKQKVRRPSNTRSDKPPPDTAPTKGTTKADFLVAEPDDEDSRCTRHQRYRPRSRSRQRSVSAQPSTTGRPSLDRVSPRTRSPAADIILHNFADIASESIQSRLSLDVLNYDDSDSESNDRQSIEEVWFSGGHADIGGGWDLEPEELALSHAPLAWMVREARRAGLVFDEDKVRELGCMDDEWEIECMQDTVGTARNAANIPGIQVSSPETPPDDEQRKVAGDPTSLLQPNVSFTKTDDDSMQQVGAVLSDYAQLIHDSVVKGKIHDCLAFKNGLPPSSVVSWRVMEYLPFRRMDLQPDGSWRPIRWPLPGGEVRDIPEHAMIHNTVIRRMRADPTYRPGNLIVGGGGRGVRVAPEEYGIGEWVVVQDEGSAAGEVMMRKSAWEKSNGKSGC